MVRSTRRARARGTRLALVSVGALTLLSVAAVVVGCDAGGPAAPSADTVDDAAAPAQCLLPSGEAPDFAAALGCADDFVRLASEPLDASIPGARSVKVVVDRMDDGRLYFQNSRRYAIHWEFARAHLSGNGKPFVGELEPFNATEYYSPDRRFVLGALTHYEGPDVWAFELAPYDTASADMIALAHGLVAEAFQLGRPVLFHPTSQSVAREAEKLEGVEVVTTERIYEGIDYQPLNLGTAFGRLTFVRSDELEDEYVDFRDIVVLDRVPNDISVTCGIITAEFQTPLSHINVLSQNRGTPNMGLRGALDSEELRALEGQWVRLRVAPFGWEVEAATAEEADAWWAEHRPETVQVPRIDTSREGLVDVGEVLDPELSQYDAVRAAIPAFGGKASHYAALAQAEGVPVPPAFVVPVFYYEQFLAQNGFDAEIERMLSEPGFLADAPTRDGRLAELRRAMRAAPVDEELLALLTTKLETDFPGVRMRFRSSTNAEDLEGFTGAGLYTSRSGDPNDPDKPIVDALRKVWASVWYFRAFEERRYRGISHREVGMALLVHRSFPDEEANGVALTANPFDSSGLEPGFYVNVQRGGASVVKPEAGTTTDQFIYQFDRPGQPIVFLAHSSLVDDGDTVLAVEQTHELGKALKAIHLQFLESYGPSADDPTAWYAMDVEFKFDGPPGEPPALFVKQARPHPGRGR